VASVQYRIQKGFSVEDFLFLAEGIPVLAEMHSMVSSSFCDSSNSGTELHIFILVYEFSIFHGRSSFKLFIPNYTARLYFEGCP